MRKACKTLTIVSILMMSAACGETPTTAGRDIQPIPAVNDAGAAMDAGTDGGTTGCAEVALACITYTCLNSGECDPKNPNETPTGCYRCIYAASRGALCKHFIDSCGQVAACFN
jgi:hypothetical protein